MRDEPQLIRDASAGDRAAFDELVRLKRERVVRTAFQVTGDLDDALDVAQGVFAVKLGAPDSVGTLQSLATNVWDAAELFLEVKLGTPDDPTAPVLAGRQRLAGAPYAWRAVPGADFRLGRGLLPAAMTSAEIAGISRAMPTGCLPPKLWC